MWSAVTHCHPAIDLVLHIHTLSWKWKRTHCWPATGSEVTHTHARPYTHTQIMLARVQVERATCAPASYMHLPNPLAANTHTRTHTFRRVFKHEPTVQLVKWSNKISNHRFELSIPSAFPTPPLISLFLLSVCSLSSVMWALQSHYYLCRFIRPIRALRRPVMILNE